MQHSNDFSKYLHATKQLFPNQDVDIIGKDTDPQRWSIEVIEPLSKLCKGVKNYEFGLYRNMDILDATKLGASLIKILNKRENVQFKYDSEALSYVIDQNSKIVRCVKTKKEDINCDILVLCNGPQAPYHIYKNFGSVLPSVQAQGYCFDVEYDDLSLHRNLSLKLDDSPYSYCPYLPGKLRFSAGFEIGCFKEPYYD